MKTLEEIVTDGNHKQKLRATALLAGRPTFEEQIREAYQLGYEIGEEKYRLELIDWKSTNQGLHDALEAKNDVTTTVTVNTTNWPIVLLTLTLITIEVYRYFHV